MSLIVWAKNRIHASIDRQLNARKKSIASSLSSVVPLFLLFRWGFRITRSPEYRNPCFASDDLFLSVLTLWVLQELRLREENMNFLFASNCVLITLWVNQLMSAQVQSCNTYSKVDAISYLYYKGIAFILTSNGNYYVIKEEDIDNKDIRRFEPSGKVPHLSNCCDASMLLDVDECPNEEDNEHSIAFVKVSPITDRNYSDWDYYWM